jgi:hypothetical protein
LCIAATGAALFLRLSSSQLQDAQEIRAKMAAESGEKLRDLQISFDRSLADSNVSSIRASISFLNVAFVCLCLEIVLLKRERRNLERVTK